jgi:hypothetical protein
VKVTIEVTTTRVYHVEASCQCSAEKAATDLIEEVRKHNSTLIKPSKVIVEGGVTFVEIR